MWYVTILYIVIFILIFLCILYACRECGGESRLNVYAMLLWTWILTVFLFAAFGIFIADEADKVLYMASVVSISTLFFVFILVWAVIDAYGYAYNNHKEIHELLCKLDNRKM